LSYKKMAVIGDKDSVMLWRALGVETIFADEPGQVDRAINRLAREGTAVIYITEQCAQMVPETIRRYLTEPFPCIIPIPNKDGSNGFGVESIRKNVEKAVGADILLQ
jgi:V/A-type H+-transporting ATPase subunit F